MASISTVIYTLIYCLGLGYFASFALVKREAVGRRYFLIHGVGTAGMLFAAILILSPKETAGLALATALCCLLFSLFQDKSRWLGNALLAAGILVGFASLFVGPTKSAGAVYTSSALLLGTTMAAMLLGHWYLSVPGLSILELRRVTVAYLAALFLRTAIAAFGLVPVVSGKSETHLYTYFFSTTGGIFLTMRWCWGLLGPLALCYFIWDTVRISSTRSATGILYVAVVFVLIGETIAHYLSAFYGIVS